MNKAIGVIIASLIIAFTSLAMYLYLSNRTEENKFKDYLKLKINRNKIILCVIGMVFSVIAFSYSYYFMEATFLKAIMNAETFLWLYTLGYIDLKEKIIPNKMILTGIGFWLILTLLEILVAHSPARQVLQFSLIGAAVCGGVLMLIALLVKSALGMGDVKMFTVLGLLYGLSNTYSIMLFSILIMAVVSVVLLLAKKVTKKTAVPMAPFVVIGFFISILLGI